VNQNLPVFVYAGDPSLTCRQGYAVIGARTRKLASTNVAKEYSMTGKIHFNNQVK
jgi:hypothetical protein